MSNLFDPIFDGVQHYTDHRESTKSEIKFGYGATHYRNLPPELVVKKKIGPLVVLKKWTVADNGLRYYR